jgi:hypothetical protein
MNTDNADSENEERYCWICHEEGQELISGCCSCRGTSGHVHKACLVQNARWKTKDAAERSGIGRGFFLQTTWLVQSLFIAPDSSLQEALILLFAL